jgi:hypothetical protein
LSEQEHEKKIHLKGKRNSDIAMMLLHWEYFLFYFSFFCLWEVTCDKDLVPQQPKRLFRAESITSSTFEVAIVKILSQARNLFYWNLPLRHEMREWKAISGSPFLRKENCTRLSDVRELNLWMELIFSRCLLLKTSGGELKHLQIADKNQKIQENF